MKKLHRRQLLKNASIVTLTLATQGYSGQTKKVAAPKNDRPKKAFWFIQAADPQLFWGPLEAWQRTVAEVNRLKPPFMVVCGDLINNAGNQKQIDAYLDTAATLDDTIKLYNVAGNHDVSNNPTPKMLANYQAIFGEPWYTFEYENCLFIILESNLIRDPSRATQAAEWQKAWLLKTFEKAQEKQYAHKFVFMHHPACFKSINEDTDKYYNLPKECRAELLKTLHENNVDAVFSGHYHQNAYVKDGPLELITTSSCGISIAQKKPKSPLGFRIVKVYPDHIEHKYYGFDDLPKNITL